MTAAPLRLLVLAALAAPAAASAHQDPATVRAVVAGWLQGTTQGLPGQVAVEVGDFDPANQLPACQRLEAFLPPGQRAWGRVSVGVRCTQPAPWTAYVPAKVKVTGPYLVTTRPLMAGQLVGPEDLKRETGDLTALGFEPLVEPAQIVGHAAKVALPAGRPLAASHLRLPAAIQQGQPVKVVTKGPGFSVGNEGVALVTAADGQPAQARLPGGQVLRGTARAGGWIEVVLP